jgi:hypothetical protein
VPATELAFGKNALEQTSFAVYALLRSLESEFGTVIFSGSTGAAYYTLNARKQGLFCQSTKFVVTLDDMLPSQKDSLLTGEDILVTSVKDLKLDFMYQKTLELSVCFLTNLVIITSQLINYYSRIRSYYHRN